MSLNRKRADEREYGRCQKQAERNGQEMMYEVERKLAAALEQNGGTFKPLSLEELINELNLLRRDLNTTFETVARLIMFCRPEYRHLGYPSDGVVMSIVMMLREGRHVDDVVRSVLKPSPSLATREMVASVLGGENLYGAAANVEIDRNAVKKEQSRQPEIAPAELDDEEEL